MVLLHVLECTFKMQKQAYHVQKRFIPTGNVFLQAQKVTEERG